VNAETLVQIERIAAAGIRLIPVPEVTSHFLFERDGFVVLVERKGEAFGGLGSPGQLAESGGFAALVTRGGEDWFISKGTERRAHTGEAEAARRLFTELKAALSNT